jgi:CRP/FNR family cyclic AMP-dependent transcriptional regulator
MEDIPPPQHNFATYDEAPPGDWKEVPPALPCLGILAGLSEQSLANLATYGHYQPLPSGTALIVEGDVQDRFYVVVAGRLSISAVVAGKEVPLSMAEAGECLGEVSLLEPGPASASVKVMDDAVLWSMNLDDLRMYLGEHAGGGGALLMGMAQCLSQRIRQTNHLIGHHHALVAEAFPKGRERAITADNSTLQLGFFDRLKKSVVGEKKVKISTEIKL